MKPSLLFSYIVGSLFLKDPFFQIILGLKGRTFEAHRRHFCVLEQDTLSSA